MNGKRLLKKGCILFFWLLLWHILSVMTDNDILLAGPLKTFSALWSNMQKMTFWKTILFSAFRIFSGFLAGLILGILLAMLSARFSLAEAFLSPFVTLLKAVPVASFVVLFLIWWHADRLSTAISFMVVFPNIYANTLEGIRNVDKKLLEMAKVFQMPWKNRFFYLYRPACRPFLDSAIKVSIGMSWKSGVAAEVIGTPQYSVGEALYMAKIYLETENVLAWTAVIIILSTICEKFIIYLWNLFCNWQPRCTINTVTGRNRQVQSPAITFAHVNKKYRELAVLKDDSRTYNFRETYFLNSPSGSGKTTIFRLISGLEKADSGQIVTLTDSTGYLFQENRLCEDYNAMLNVSMVSTNPEKSRRMLEELLLPEDLEKPCRELSGGMKRRVALVRAFSIDSSILLLDEPFTGLDVENVAKVKAFIEKYKQNSCVLLATHLPL